MAGGVSGAFDRLLFEAQFLRCHRDGRAGRVVGVERGLQIRADLLELLDDEAVDRDRQAARGVDAEPATPVERVDDRVRGPWQEGENGLVDQIERQGGADRKAFVVGDADVVRDRLARLWKRIGRNQFDVENLGGARDGELDVPDLRLRHRRRPVERRERRLSAADENDGDVDVRDVLLGDRKSVDRAVRFEADDLAGQDPGALDRDQRPLLAGERARDEDLGGVADAILRPVADQGDPIVVAPTPRHGLRAAGPKEQARPDRPPERVGARDDDLVRPADRWNEREPAVAAPVGREGAGGDLGVDRRPRPPPAAGIVLLEDVLPLAPIDGVGQRSIADPLAAPIDGDHLDVDRIAGSPDRSRGREADVEVPGVHDERVAPGEGLTVVSDGGRLDGQRPASRPRFGVLEVKGPDVARQLDQEDPIAVRTPASLEDRRRRLGRPPPAGPTDPRIVLVGEGVALEPRR